MAKCLKCGNELVYIEDDNVNYCPKCGEKYKTVSSPEQNDIIELTIQEENKTTIHNKEPKSLYEQFKSEIKQKHLIKPKWLIHLIAIALIITCLAICATPISYNTKFVNKENQNYYNETYSIIFQRNNICKSQYGSKTSNIQLYYIENDAVCFENRTVLKIINRTTLQYSDGEIYKAENGGEIFLIVITVLWSIFSIALAIFDYNKKITKHDRLKETN